MNSSLESLCHQILKHPLVYDAGIQKGIGNIKDFTMCTCLLCKSTIKFDKDIYYLIEGMYLLTITKQVHKDGTAVHKRHDLYVKNDASIPDLRNPLQNDYLGDDIIGGFI